MFDRRNLLISLRTTLGQHWFRFYVMNSWLCGSNEDMARWCQELLDAKQLFFPFYPVTFDHTKKPHTPHEPESSSNGSNSFNHPFLPF